MLAGAEAGEHYFLVCVLTDHGELANVIPHRYLLSENGRLVHDFDGLEQTEREEYFSIQVQSLPTLEQLERYEELGARGLAYNLPPAHTVQDLVRAVPGLVTAPSNAACWEFLSAIGICRPRRLPN